MKTVNENKKQQLSAVSGIFTLLQKKIREIMAPEEVEVTFLDVKSYHSYVYTVIRKK